MGPASAATPQTGLIFRAVHFLPNDTEFSCHLDTSTMSSKSSNKESSNVRHPRGSQLSEVWAYYNRIEDSFDVICKQEKCRKVIERKDNKHTFAMWTHLQQAHEDIYKTTKHSQQRGQQKKLELEKVRK